MCSLEVPSHQNLRTFGPITKVEGYFEKIVNIEKKGVSTFYEYERRRLMKKLFLLF